MPKKKERKKSSTDQESEPVVILDAPEKEEIGEPDPVEVEENEVAPLPTARDHRLPSRCIGRNRSGKQCMKTPLEGEEHCKTHHPNRESDGKFEKDMVLLPKDLKKFFPDEFVSAGDVLKVLHLTMSKVLLGKLDPRLASTAASIANTVMRAMESGKVDATPGTMRIAFSRPGLGEVRMEIEGQLGELKSLLTAVQNAHSNKQETGQEQPPDPPTLSVRGEAGTRKVVVSELNPNLKTGGSIEGADPGSSDPRPISKTAKLEEGPPNLKSDPVSDEGKEDTEEPLKGDIKGFQEKAEDGPGEELLDSEGYSVEDDEKVGEVGTEVVPYEHHDPVDEEE